MARACRDCGRPPTEHDCKSVDFQCGRCRTAAWKAKRRPPAPPRVEPGTMRTCECGFSEPVPLTKRRSQAKFPWMCRPCAAKAWRGTGVPRVEHRRAEAFVGCCPVRAKKIADLMLDPDGSERLAKLMRGHQHHDLPAV